MDVRLDQIHRTLLHEAASVLHVQAIVALVAHGADVNARTTDGRSSLHEAAKRNCSFEIKVLIAEGTDVDAVDRRGRTALYFATMQRDSRR